MAGAGRVFPDSRTSFSILTDDDGGCTRDTSSDELRIMPLRCVLLSSRSISWTSSG